jgi:hypothetical protein
MLDAPAATDQDAEAFLALDQALRTSGPEAAIDQLIRTLTARGESRALLDALLLKARHELGLPLIQAGPLGEIPEPTRSKYEERYVEAIREVGGRLLDSGDIPGAWPYFRAISEPDRVAKAIDAYVPDGGDETLGQVIEVAFNQGANPRKGFELILDHYGTCSSISAFEHLPPDEATRSACADRLVRRLHEHLVANLRAEIAQRGQPLPPEGAAMAELLEGRDWLFSDDAYHIDVSHLAATVRVAPLLTDPETIAQAIGLTDYGRRLSIRHQYEGEPPFEQTYEDHAAYLRALLGQDVDASIAHFRAKLTPPDPDERDVAATAQVLVGLLVKLGRLDEAIDLAAEYLARYPDSALSCPGVAQLCQRAGHPGRLARIARDHGDLVNYAAAVLQAGPGGATA